MEIFGVSPIEFLLVAVLGLIIFGPERLPEIGRFLGRMVARVLAWQYTSPEAQLLNELKRDFEKQIYDIRDEMVRASQQLDVRSELQEIQRETEALLRGKSYTPPTNTPRLDQIHLADQQQTIAPPQGAQDVTTDTTVTVPFADAATSTQDTGELSATAFSQAELTLLTAQIQTLADNFRAMQEQLLARGVLSADWQSPSHDTLNDMHTSHEPDEDLVAQGQTEGLRAMEPEETI